MFSDGVLSMDKKVVIFVSTPSSMRLPLLAGILLSISTSSFSQKGNNLFNSSVVHEIRMYSNDPNLWQDLLTHYNESQNGGENVYNPVDIIIDGTSLSSVG